MTIDLHFSCLAADPFPHPPLLFPLPAPSSSSSCSLSALCRGLVPKEERAKRELDTTEKHQLFGRGLAERDEVEKSERSTALIFPFAAGLSSLSVVFCCFECVLQAKVSVLLRMLSLHFF